MTYFFNLVQELIQHLVVRHAGPIQDLYLEQDLGRLLNLQTTLQDEGYPNLSDSDLRFFIELGRRYDLILQLDQYPTPLWVAWVGLSTEMGQMDADWRLADLLVQYASQLRTASLDRELPRVAVFGASFNPITLGHVDLIRALLAHPLSELATVAVMPARQSPFKSSSTYATVSDRVQLIDRVLQAELTPQDYARIRIDMTEIVRPPPSWMVMTLTALILTHRAQEAYVVVCGYDHLLSMQQWYQWQALANLGELWFYPRIGIAIANEANIDACSALCQAGIQVRIVFTTSVDQQAFAALYQKRHPEHMLGLQLIVDPRAQIRATSATEIRSQYQTATSSTTAPPVGLSAVAHQYILEHQCYLHSSARTTPTKNSKTKLAKGIPPGTR